MWVRCGPFTSDGWRDWVFKVDVSSDSSGDAVFSFHLLLVWAVSRGRRRSLKNLGSSLFCYLFVLVSI